MSISKLLYSAIKTPIKFVLLIGSMSKNALYIMSLIMLLDFMHLQNQILKKKYKAIYNRPYTPLHTRVASTIKGATYLSLPAPNSSNQ